MGTGEDEAIVRDYNAGPDMLAAHNPNDTAQNVRCHGSLHDDGPAIFQGKFNEMGHGYPPETIRKLAWLLG